MIRKILLAVILSTISCIILEAQEYSYSLTRGKVSSTVHWTEKDLDGGIRTIRISPFPGRVYTQKVDSQCRTVSWHFDDKADNTDLSISLKNGIYTLSGTFKGKAINRTVKSEGYPWYQNISYASGRKLKTKGAALTYECFRPDNLDFQSMIATNIGTENIAGRTTNNIKVCAKGAKGKLWSCNYYADAVSGVLVCYKAVEGLPGTPLTTWMLNK